MGVENKTETKEEIILIDEEMLKSKIYVVRDQKVMLDFELAEITLHDLKAMLDDSVELNHIMLGYMRLWLDMLEQKTDLFCFSK